jgi:hypothetical protein
MYKIQIDDQTPNEVKLKMSKIIEAFSMDKDELDRILRYHFDIKDEENVNENSKLV